MVGQLNGFEIGVLVGGIFIYAGAVYAGNWWFLAAPLRHQVLGDTSKTRMLLLTLRKHLEPGDDAVLNAASRQLDAAEELVGKERPRLSLTFAKAIRAHNDVMSVSLWARTQPVDRWPHSFAPAVAEELRSSGERTLARQLEAASGSSAKTLVPRLRAGIERLERDVSARLLASTDSHRRSMWLAYIGLALVGVTAMVFGGLEPLILGAVGGFLSPTVRTLTNRRARTDWHVLMLSPIGGSLAAFAGIILVGFLASLDLLGEALKSVAFTNTSSATLATAIVLGFSGRSFSRLAMGASERAFAFHDERSAGEEPEEPESTDD